MVLLRHGQSEWNARNLFTGWANPDLTEAGKRGAERAGNLLRADGVLPDTVPVPARVPPLSVKLL